MREDIALKRYLERHIEPNLPNAPQGINHWQHMLVIPAYDESPELLRSLSRLCGSGKTVVILVLNRPDSDPDTSRNNPLRDAIGQLEPACQDAEHGLNIYSLGASIELFFYDMDTIKGPNPAAQGVGLARKVGCDIALLWQYQGAISSDWICCSDADAALPKNYFSRLDQAANSGAAVFPFAHQSGVSSEVSEATALYELRLHHYVLGLNYAKSPYAYHTLGSCIAIKRQQYAQIRGYPKRSGGEDFYVLNKLAKVGSIASLDGECIAIASRRSHRVPFGTGPAVEKIISENDVKIFYHPDCFESLRALLAVVPTLRESSLEKLISLLIAQGLAPDLALLTSQTLNKMNFSKAITHCRQHGKEERQFVSQFNQWFDGFRTLKFIHAIRDSRAGMICLEELLSVQPALFPGSDSRINEVEALLGNIRKELGWTTKTMK
ncbi:MAG: hypothetical protein ACI8QT_000526 [Halioglobus sp.]|jgi:hypothetical protein